MEDLTRLKNRREYHKKQKLSPAARLFCPIRNKDSIPVGMESFAWVPRRRGRDTCNAESAAGLPPSDPQILNALHHEPLRDLRQLLDAGTHAPRPAIFQKPDAPGRDKGVEKIPAFVGVLRK